ncbi:MAG TPA: S8 family peptidase [Thermoanaerobaculia bacterium]|nr:S8 family peptidase [Thermoanaerobaculia bacterium]
MRWKSKQIVLVAAGLCTLVPVCFAAADAAKFRSAGPDAVPDRWIVLLEEAAVGGPAGQAAGPQRVRELALDLGRIFGLEVERTWGHAVNAFLVTAPEPAARRLARHPFVAIVEPDVHVAAAVPNCYTGTTFPSNGRALPSSSDFQSQAISCSDPATSCVDNWGIDRIDQRSLPRDGSYSWGLNGTGVYVYVLDTGINYHYEFRDHFGLQRLERGLGVNTTVPVGHADRGDSTDDLGHGTHVAGILGGRTYGVAKDVHIVPVKVFVGGGGDVSYLIDGIDFVRAQQGEYGWEAVATLSANSSAWRLNTTLVTAVQNLIGAGVQLVQSAGNQASQHSCTYSLGGVTDALVVGGTTVADQRWSGSNFGTCVDLFAPAADVFSSYAGTDDGFEKRYCELTGTSMAAPHVAGALAIYLESASYTPGQLRGLVLGDATAGALGGLGTGSPNLLLYVP